MSSIAPSRRSPSSTSRVAAGRGRGGGASPIASAIPFRYGASSTPSGFGRRASQPPVTSASVMPRLGVLLLRVLEVAGEAELGVVGARRRGPRPARRETRPSARWRGRTRSDGPRGSRSRMRGSSGARRAAPARARPSSRRSDAGGRRRAARGPRRRSVAGRDVDLGRRGLHDHVDASRPRPARPRPLNVRSRRDRAGASATWPLRSAGRRDRARRARTRPARPDRPARCLIVMSSHT